VQQAYAGEQRLSYFDLAAFSQQSVLATFDDDLATFDDVTLLLQFQEVVFVFFRAMLSFEFRGAFAGLMCPPS